MTTSETWWVTITFHWCFIEEQLKEQGWGLLHTMTPGGEDSEPQNNVHVTVFICSDASWLLNKIQLSFLHRTSQRLSSAEIQPYLLINFGQFNSSGCAIQRIWQLLQLFLSFKWTWVIVVFLWEVCKLNSSDSSNHFNSFQDPEKETKYILC